MSPQLRARRISLDWLKVVLLLGRSSLPHFSLAFQGLLSWTLEAHRKKSLGSAFKSVQPQEDFGLANQGDLNCATDDLERGAGGVRAVLGRRRCLPWVPACFSLLLLQLFFSPVAVETLVGLVGSSSCFDPLFSSAFKVGGNLEIENRFYSIKTRACRLKKKNTKTKVVSK